MADDFIVLFNNTKLTALKTALISNGKFLFRIIDLTSENQRQRQCLMKFYKYNNINSSTIIRRSSVLSTKFNKNLVQYIEWFF